jgi:uncharacterized membrane protein YfcA
MIPTTIAILVAAMVGTAFLSGIFGMAGGLILVGILLAIMPLPEAMMLHGTTQLASNGWRGAMWFRYVRWRPVAAYIAGCALAMAAWSFTRYVPGKPLALLLLGVTPFTIRLLPARFKPNPESNVQTAACGTVCMSLILLTGVSGPLVDTFFLGGKMDRREIVATKAICQMFGHLAKILYFGALIDQTASVDPLIAALAIAASMVGTTLAGRVLQAMTDNQFRAWANGLITVIASYYILQSVYLFVVS